MNNRFNFFKNSFFTFLFFISYFSFAQYVNIGFAKKQIIKDINIFSKQHPNFIIQNIDGADSLHITASDENAIEQWNFHYHFSIDEFDEMACDSAVYKFVCTECAESYLKETMETEKWIQISQNVYYSKFAQKTEMKVQEFVNEKYCMVITLVKRNWTKSEYQLKTKLK